ncbi:GMC family oxidoreductase [Yoonia sp. BS5-3]|uniref:GMC oxidoreductase n=1 Tax=Yoonia phaeophyticola TaxID=3137369 RepID=A0ABZ2V7B7_9RHOB
MVHDKKYDVVIVGTGFASAFFLKRVLEGSDVSRVLVLERGQRHSYDWQLDHQRNNDLADRRPHNEAGLEKKFWNYNIGFGGGSNCWWTNTMRIHPEEFELRTRYGVGDDWPISYEDLEPYYCDAEDEMLVSGDNSSAVLFPRSRPFPQPRHRYSGVGSALKMAYPEHTFAMPTTRARVANDSRGVCCAIGRCNLCPNKAKFTIVEEMAYLFDDPRVTLILDAEVDGIETSAGLASAVTYRKGDRAFRVETDFVALGANGIFNPFILLKSGIDDGPVGRGVVEQIPIYLTVDFETAKTEGYSSFVGAVNYSFSTGPHRRNASGGFLEVVNKFEVRPHKEKWNNRAAFTFLMGDMRQDDNRVTIDPDAPDRPLVSFNDWSPYAYNGVAHIRTNIENFLAPLGVERFEVSYDLIGSHSHIEGTTVMGSDPAASVVDKDLLHHRVRNLAVLGSGAFVTSPGSNPTLTIAAMSLRSADRTILGRA